MSTRTDSYKRKNVNKKTTNNPFLYVNFSKNDYTLDGKNTEEYVETRIRNYNSLKTKTTRSILPDPESVKQYVRRRNIQCYQYKHGTDRWPTQIDPSTSGWTRTRTVNLCLCGSMGNGFQMSL